MELIGRVFIMTLCVLAAYSIPSLTAINIGEENLMLPVLLSKYQRAVTTTAKPPTTTTVNNNSQISCTTKFSDDVNKINNQTVNQTQECYKSADAALLEFDVKVLNKTVADVNAISKNIQMSLANCSTKTTNINILACYLDTFDTNMANLNNISSQSQVAASSINSVEYSVEIEAKICVNKVLVNNKVNSSIAANDLQSCLSNTTVSDRNVLKSSELKTKILHLN